MSVVTESRARTGFTDAGLAFTNAFSARVATDESMRHKSYRLRHDVYCVEKGFEPCRGDLVETDKYDLYSQHGLIQSNFTEEAAGSVRYVMPTSSSQLLPIEASCSDAITELKLHPSRFDRHDIGEVSRLAVIPAFRKNGKQGAKEAEAMKLVSTSLYFLAGALAVANKRTHNFVMIEPRLARAMRLVGVNFTQIGDVVDYHGERAPFYINSQTFLSELTPASFDLYSFIEKDLRRSLAPLSV
tara:strand:+ start:22824 stop:23552 length:729 start_codon:yes stop_codon:yes gene_type:complete